jgi:flavin-dependent dehydrogenase
MDALRPTTEDYPHPDVVVIGGGPSGAVVARLLASWGYGVRLLTRPADGARALANSLPPSTQKLLAQVDLLDLVDRVGYRTTGNTVWWGGREGQVQPFSADGSAWGYQIDRAVLDPLLLAAAVQSGVTVDADAVVRRVDLRQPAARVEYDSGGAPTTVDSRFVLDCSGRAGVVAASHGLRRHVHGGRMQALIGVWTCDPGWSLENPSHTVIETCRDGWAWSLPTSGSVRHVGIMVDGPTSRITRGASLEATYRAQLAFTPRMDGQVGGAQLARVFACDASIYTATAHAGDRFLLVGDAGSTLNPLSSFGVKKALASAWLASIVVNTCLAHPERAVDARAFFSRWASEIWQVNLERSREFAREALAAHASPFWQTQADAAVDESIIPPDDAELLSAPEVLRALERLRAADTVVFSQPGERALVSAPIVRGNLIEIEPAVALGPAPRDRRRYVRRIDLVALVAVAQRHTTVPAIYDDYCGKRGPSPLPDVLASLSLLLARGVLRATPQDASACSSSRS